MALRERPAPLQPVHRTGALDHDRGRVEAHGHEDVDREDAAQYESAKETADQRDPGAGERPPAARGGEDEREEEDQRHDDEGEGDQRKEEVRAENAQEPLDPSTQGVVDGHRFAAEPAHRELGHAPGDDAAQDRGRDDRRCRVEQEGQQARAARDGAGRSPGDCPSDPEGPDQGEGQRAADHPRHRCQHEVYDEVRREVLRPDFEGAREDVACAAAAHRRTPCVRRIAARVRGRDGHRVGGRRRIARRVRRGIRRWI